MLLIASVSSAAAVERLAGVLHLHSTLSTGSFTPEELAAQAEREELGALLFTENLLLRFEYGMAPFRALTRVAREERSVLDDLDGYLGRMAALRRRHPRLVIVAGVEVVPHYFWTGSPLALELALHATQKNLLVFGLNDAPALRSLPVTGNPAARELTLQSLIDALPALLIVPGLVILARPRVRRVRFGAAVIVVRRRRWLQGGLVLGVGVLAAVRAWPFTVDPYPPWEAFGLDPHQAVIDHVERRGGLTVWSFPEAPDAGQRQFGPVRVSWQTEPYPDDLLRTTGYTAFGAVYEQPTRFARSGGGWDRLLTQYAAGERERPVWAVGESGFHGTRAGKRLVPVQTVFLVNERTEAGVLDALKRGRMYALRRSGDVTLVLSDLAAVSAAASAGMGETLAAPAGTPIEVRATIEAAGGGQHPLRVTLLKNGDVAGTWSAATPLRIVHRDTADARRTVYRLDARVSTADYLVSNPVFVAP